MRGAWDHEITGAPEVHPVRLLNAYEAGGYSAVTELYGIAREKRTLTKLLNLARDGRLPTPTNRPRRPLPRRHYQADWAAHGIAA